MLPSDDTSKSQSPGVGALERAFAIIGEALAQLARLDLVVDSYPVYQKILINYNL